MRHYRRPMNPRWLWLALVVLLVAFRFWSERQIEQGPEVLSEGIYRVSRVVDGDTIRLESGARVRLQGIDTPETVKPDHPVEAWGHEAHQFTESFITNANWQVRLTFGNERIDQYGRFLAFVWDADRLLNEELVRVGFAHAKLGYRYSGSMKTRLRKAQEEARHAQRGIWSVAASPP